MAFTTINRLLATKDFLQVHLILWPCPITLEISNYGQHNEFVDCTVSLTA